MDKIIRIATLTNFNCTNKEYKQLKSIVGNKRHFVNTNIKSITKITAKNVNKHKTPIVLTINPDIIYNPDYITKLKLINKSIVAFIRLKYCPGYNHTSIYHTLINMGYNVVITNQRFKSKVSFHRYILPEYWKQYHFHGSYYRLKQDYMPKMFIFICDRKGKGCKACMLCAKLTFNLYTEITGLNLSTSGKCKFNCPDCFAKQCLKQSKGKIAYNEIKSNAKQKSKLKTEVN